MTPQPEKRPRALYEWRGKRNAEDSFPPEEPSAPIAPESKFNNRCPTCHGPAEKVASGFWCDACAVGFTQPA